MTKQITITVEQDNKKAIIILTGNEQGGMNVKANWEPALDKEHPQGKDLLTMQILEMLKRS